MFSTPVPDITNLKARITDAFAPITEDMLENTWREIDYRWLSIRRSPCNKRSTCWNVLMCCKKNFSCYILKKKKVCIPRSFLVVNVCNQGKTLRSPCRSNFEMGIYFRRFLTYLFYQRDWYPGQTNIHGKSFLCTELFNIHSEKHAISSSIQHSEISHGKMWLQYPQLFTPGRRPDSKARKKMKGKGVMCLTNQQHATKDVWGSGGVTPTLLKTWN